jgi:prevent-host-death family protein
MSNPIPATEFKATCLALLDRVADGRESFVITKRGKPVARLVPLATPRKERKSLLGSVSIVDPNDDLLSTGIHWDVEGGRR